MANPRISEISMEASPYGFVFNKSCDIGSKHPIANLLRIFRQGGIFRLEEIERLRGWIASRINEPVNYIQRLKIGFGFSRHTVPRDLKIACSQSDVGSPCPNITKFYGGFYVPEFFPPW